LAKDLRNRLVPQSACGKCRYHGNFARFQNAIRLRDQFGAIEVQRMPDKHARIHVRF
jgi:hypothetical protein